MNSKKLKKGVSLLFILLSSVVLLNAQNYIPTSTWEGPIPATEQEDPEPLVWVKDSVFNTWFMKVSNSDIPDAEQGYGGSDRTYYSLRPVFNENSSMFLLNSGKIYKTETNEYVGRTWYLAGNTSFGNPMWSKVKPTILYGTINLKFVAMDVITGDITVIRDMGVEDGFESDNGRIYMDNKQSISGNDSLIVLSDIPHGGRKIVVVNIQTGERHAWIEDAVAYAAAHNFSLRDFGSDEPRMNIGISPSSKYVVLGGTVEQLLDDKLNWIRSMPEHGHADFAVDMEGNDVYVSICPAKYEILETGEVIDLLGPDSYACGHLNGSANYKQPGWAYLSIDADNNDIGANGNPQGFEIVAVQLDRTGTTVRRVIHPRNTDHTKAPSSEMNEHPAYGVPNPEGTLLMFNSKWGDYNAPTNAYMVRLTAPFKLTTTTKGKGKVMSSANGEYEKGEKVKITAVPDWGESFLRWEGDISSTQNPLTITIDSSMNLVAVFSGYVTGISNNDDINNSSLISYPNPVSKLVTIKYKIEESADIKLSVNDINGKEIAVLVNKYQQKGVHEYFWDGNEGNGKELPNGLYICKLAIENRGVITSKIIFNR